MVSEKGQLLGYLEAYDPVDRQLPSEELVRHLEVFAGKAASTLELLRLYGQLEEQATTDGLTGLYNHRHLLQRVEEEVAKARRYGTPVSLLMIDIDDFKPFNDTYGHPQGDKLLQEMADILRAGVRQTGRPGGALRRGGVRRAAAEHAVGRGRGGRRTSARGHPRPAHRRGGR